MAGPDERIYDQLPGQRDGLVQQHIVLDGQDRAFEVYTAAIGAKDGEACTKVTYAYKDAASVIVVAMREENAAWDNTFNAGFFTERTT